jgi:AraC-like DNA-binding protein
LALAWIMSIARRGTEGQVVPLRLELTRPEGQRELLESHFGCPVRFKAPGDALVFRDRDLDRPFVTSNADLREVIGAQLDAELRVRTASRDVGEQVRGYVRRSLAGRRPTLQQVAKEMGLSARTLQRRLTDSAISFQRLVEETRRDLACHYLKHSRLELNETAFLLGYSDANSFFRAFHAWEGSTPGEWRERHRASDGDGAVAG